MIIFDTMGEAPTHLICPHCGGKVIRYRNPLPTVDVIIRYQHGVVMIQRANPPYGWAIPGGFVDYGESAEEAAIREMREETGLDLENLKLFTVRSDPKRDPRHHTLSVVYTADGVGDLIAGDDARKVTVYTLETLPTVIAFDHRDILEMYFKER